MYLREKATCIPSLNTYERVQTSPSNNGNVYIERAVDLNKRIQKDEKRLTELQTMAAEFIETVDDDLTRDVLKMRYINCYTWDMIGDLLGYVTRWMQKIEAKAVNDL